MQLMRLSKFASINFPPVEHALAEPDGLLAQGGDLSPERLLEAYRRGIFPWYSDDQPILWWSPSQRTVFDTAAAHIPRRMLRWLRQCDWTIEADGDFAEVMHACSAPRAGHHGTWITEAMLDAYAHLHALGHAHALAVRAADGTLVGGIYGVALGRMFYGESMFSARSNGSKVALLALCAGLSRWGFPLLDAQMSTPHLHSLGAFELPRARFCAQVATLCAQPGREGSWRGVFPFSQAAALAQAFALPRTPSPAA